MCAMLLLVVIGSARAIEGPGTTVEDLIECKERCHDQYDRCLTECPANDMQWLSKGMLQECKNIHILCIAACKEKFMMTYTY